MKTILFLFSFVSAPVVHSLIVVLAVTPPWNIHHFVVTQLIFVCSYMFDASELRCLYSQTLSSHVFLSLAGLQTINRLLYQQDWQTLLQHEKAG